MVHKINSQKLKLMGYRAQGQDRAAGRTELSLRVQREGWGEGQEWIEHTCAWTQQGTVRVHVAVTPWEVRCQGARRKRRQH